MPFEVLEEKGEARFEFLKRDAQGIAHQIHSSS